MKNKELTPEELNTQADVYAQSVWGRFGLVESRGMVDEYSQSQTDFIAGFEFADQQTAALREEIQKDKATCENCSTKITALREELEEQKESKLSAISQHQAADIELANTSEKLEWYKEQFGMLKESYSKILPELEAVKKERDEAVKLLDRARFVIQRASGKEPIIAEIKEVYDRLSSGETKPKSPWSEIQYPLLTGIVHDVKCWPPFFRNVADGSKLFEVRKNDREYKVGDELFIREYNPETLTYTGYNVPTIISYVLNGGQFGIEPGYCVLSLLYKEGAPGSLTDKNSDQ